MIREKKRIYNSEARDAQAAQTRSRILEAAKELFQTEGFDRVTIGKLAKAAEVSMPTIYGIFKSKRGVLQSLIDEALPPNQFWALVEDAKQEKSPKIRLGISAKMARQIYDAERELIDILRSASVIAPELKELEQEREKHGGKKPYHTMIAAYFLDMAKVWTALRRVVKDGGLVCFVVGDSAPYGIYVPVDRWLGELALSAGFKSFRFEKLRDRNVKWKNRKHRVPLHEGRLWIEG